MSFAKVSLRGRCRRQRGVPYRNAYLVVAGDPPLSLRDISPRKGGRGELRVSHWSLQGGAGELIGASNGIAAGYCEQALARGVDSERLRERGDGGYRLLDCVLNRTLPVLRDRR